MTRSRKTAQRFTQTAVMNHLELTSWLHTIFKWHRASLRQLSFLSCLVEVTYSDFGGDKQCDDKAVDGNGFTEDDADQILGSDARCFHTSAHNAWASIEDPTKQNQNHSDYQFFFYVSPGKLSHLNLKWLNPHRSNPPKAHPRCLTFLSISLIWVKMFSASCS